MKKETSSTWSQSRIVLSSNLATLKSGALVNKEGKAKIDLDTTTVGKKQKPPIKDDTSQIALLVLVIPHQS
jgi:hypothetical protein